MSDSSYFSLELLPRIEDKGTAVGSSCTKSHVYRDYDDAKAASDRQLEMSKEVRSTYDVEGVSFEATTSTGSKKPSTPKNTTILDDDINWDKKIIVTQQKKIRLQEYQIDVLKASIRQYQNKIFKFQRLCKAALNRDDELWDAANNSAMTGVIPDGDVKSDTEDDNVKNTVEYKCNVCDYDP